MSEDTARPAPLPRVRLLCPQDGSDVTVDPEDLAAFIDAKLAADREGRTRAAVDEIEITEEMLDAGVYAISSFVVMEGAEESLLRLGLSAAFRAMLDAEIARLRAQAKGGAT